MQFDFENDSGGLLRIGKMGEGRVMLNAGYPLHTAQRTKRNKPTMSPR